MKISIITITYNNVKTLNTTIRSVLNQDYSNIEYIIIDGKSSDGTLNILKYYSEKIDKLICERDNGIYDALNKGIAEATGDVIGFIHAGDKLKYKFIISSIVEYFEKYETDIIYGDKIYVDAKTRKKIRHWSAKAYDKKNFKNGWMPPHLSTYIKRSCYQKWGNFRTDFKIAADYELLLRFMYLNNASAKYLPEVIAEMETGGISNRSLKNILISNYEVYKSWKINGLKISPGIILKKPLRKINQFFE